MCLSLLLISWWANRTVSVAKQCLSGCQENCSFIYKVAFWVTTTHTDTHTPTPRWLWIIVFLFLGLNSARSAPGRRVMIGSAQKVWRIAMHVTSLYDQRIRPSSVWPITQALFKYFLSVWFPASLSLFESRVPRRESVHACVCVCKRKCICVCMYTRSQSGIPRLVGWPLLVMAVLIRRAITGVASRWSLYLASVFYHAAQRHLWLSFLHLSGDAQRGSDFVSMKGL